MDWVSSHNPQQAQIAPNTHERNNDLISLTAETQRILDIQTLTLEEAYNQFLTNDLTLDDFLSRIANSSPEELNQPFEDGNTLTIHLLKKSDLPREISDPIISQIRETVTEYLSETDGIWDAYIQFCKGHLDYETFLSKIKQSLPQSLNATNEDLIQIAANIVIRTLKKSPPILSKNQQLEIIKKLVEHEFSNQTAPSSEDRSLHNMADQVISKIREAVIKYLSETDHTLISYTQFYEGHIDYETFLSKIEQSSNTTDTYNTLILTYILECIITKKPPKLSKNQQVEIVKKLA